LGAAAFQTLKLSGRFEIESAGNHKLRSAAKLKPSSTMSEIDVPGSTSPKKSISLSSPVSPSLMKNAVES